jgi:hypothetical protein
MGQTALRSASLTEDETQGNPILAAAQGLRAALTLCRGLGCLLLLPGPCFAASLVQNGPASRSGSPLLLPAAAAPLPCPTHPH